MARTEKIENNCLGMFTNFDHELQRLQLAVSSFEHLSKFKNTVETVYQNRSELEKEGCKNLGQSIADLAFEAEKYSRVSSKLSLESFNFLRDSGNLEKVLEKLTKNAAKAKNGREFFPNILKNAGKALAKQDLNLDLSFLQKAEEFFQQVKLETKPDKNRTRVNFNLFDGRKSSFVIDSKSRPGGLGRVSVAEYFSRENILLGNPTPIYTPDDCHHAIQYDPGMVKHPIIDAYGSFVATQKLSNELIYSYARRVDELGAGRVEGKDPVTAAVGIALAIAATLFIAGVVIEVGCAEGWWDGDVCDWGWGLIAAGIIIAGIVCVASGYCNLVVIIFLPIGA